MKNYIIRLSTRTVQSYQFHDLTALSKFNTEQNYSVIDIFITEQEYLFMKLKYGVEVIDLKVYDNKDVTLVYWPNWPINVSIAYILEELRP